MAYNEEYILKRGEVGSVIDFVLRDDDGPVNLNGWTVTLTAKLGDEDAAILNGACVLAPDQPTTGKGKGTFTFDEASADIPAGSYKLEFKGIAPGDNVHYFPKSKVRAYASLIVIDPLS